MMRLMAIGLAMLFVAACGDSKPPEKTIFEPQVEALKKAREVGQTVEEEAKKQREQIERETAK